MPVAAERTRKHRSRAKLIYRCLIRFRTIDASAPMPMPITKGRHTEAIMMSGEVAAPPLTEAITEITVKKTATPITSSMAARGMSVCVTGPLV